MTALAARPVKNRSLLPQPRSAPILRHSNVDIPANEGLYPLPNDTISPPFPRRTGVLACRLPHRPFCPKPIAQSLKPGNFSGLLCVSVQWLIYFAPPRLCVKSGSPDPPREIIKLHQTKSNHRNYERSTQRQNRTPPQGHPGTSQPPAGERRESADARRPAQCPAGSLGHAGGGMCGRAPS